MIYEKQADYIGNFGFTRYTEERTRVYSPLLYLHKSTEILIVESGEYQVYVNGEKRILRRGEINFVESLKPHTSGSTGNFKELSVYIMVISDAYLSKVVDIDKKTFPPFLKCDEGFEEILRFVKWNFERYSEMNEEMKIGFVTLLFGLFKKHFPFIDKTDDKGSELPLKIMQYISENYKEEITLESLSAAMKYESTYLSKVFNRYFDMNLREYLNRYRISEYLKLKSKNPSEPNCRIAREVGFVSNNTFYRALNKYGEESQHIF